MTKLEAIEGLTIILKEATEDDNSVCYITNTDAEVLQIAIECIQHCIDEEDDPCYDCYDKHCENCLYSGRIPE